MKAWLGETVRKRSFVSSPARRCLFLPLQFSHHYELSCEAGLTLTGKIRHDHFHNIQISTVRNIAEFSVLSLFPLLLKDKLSLHHVLAVNVAVKDPYCTAINVRCYSTSLPCVEEREWAIEGVCPEVSPRGDYWDKYDEKVLQLSVIWE